MKLIFYKTDYLENGKYKNELIIINHNNEVKCEVGHKMKLSAVVETGTQKIQKENSKAFKRFENFCFNILTVEVLSFMIL